MSLRSSHLGLWMLFPLDGPSLYAIRMVAFIYRYHSDDQALPCQKGAQRRRGRENAPGVVHVGGDASGLVELSVCERWRLLKTLLDAGTSPLTAPFTRPHAVG
jgi:hypothetical protein